MESVPKPSGCATASSFKELVPPKIAMCADERVVCTPSTRVPAMATTRAAAASRNKIASTPIRTTDALDTMISFLSHPDFLGDATEVDSFFIFTNCNRSLLRGIINISQRLSTRDISCWNVLTQGVNHALETVRANTSRVCNSCAAMLTAISAGALLPIGNPTGQ